MLTKPYLWVNRKKLFIGEEALEQSLLTYLRDTLNLKGTKRGCDTGHCGSCTVLIDGKAKKSCRLSMSKLKGRNVETIENLSSPNQEMHYIQAAFLKAGAVQCGFCTPGMIMATKAFLDNNPNPDEDSIKKALKGNICRCTGYVKIIDAVKLALEYKNTIQSGRALNNKMPETAWVGQSYYDYDGAEKVKGTLLFADDLNKKGILYGKVVRSKYPHALIKAVNIDKAKDVQGVEEVFTAKDIPGQNKMGHVKRDQPVLCDSVVRYIGDAIAVVFAETDEISRKAAEVVEVEYEELKGIFSPEEALKDGALDIHPGGNICHKLHYQAGDVQLAKVESELIVRGRFKTPAVEHAYLEPEAGLADIENGTLTLRIPSQGPFDIRDQVSEAMGIPQEKVRVILTPLGGGFGGKTDATIEVLLALGALKLKRPVKITLDREESLCVSTKKHPFVLDYEVGFNQQGKILFVSADLLADAGPYTAHSPRVIDQACIFSCGPYEVTNVDVKGVAVFTNNANASAMRGFGINQAAVAIESLLDEAAYKLKLDPFTLMFRNALEVGKKTITGQTLTASVGMKETIRRCKESLERDLAYYKKYNDNKKIGIGIACGYKNVGAGKGRVEDAGAIFKLMNDGKVQARISGVDMGQGFRSAIIQIVSQSIGATPKNIVLITGDTYLTHRHNAAAGERQLLLNGKAAHIAALEFKKRILDYVAKNLSYEYDCLDLYNHKVVYKDDHTKAILSLEELANILPEDTTIQSECKYAGPTTYPLSDTEALKNISSDEYRNYPSYAYATHVAIVEIDANSKKPRVLKVIAAHDVGVAINPQKIEGQIEGSVVMGQGYALTEKYELERGFMKTKTYLNCGVPTILEAPEIETIIIEDPEPQGPYGAKGMSEMATIPTTPAILNAIFNATGKRVYTIPLHGR